MCLEWIAWFSVIAVDVAVSHHVGRLEGWQVYTHPTSPTRFSGEGEEVWWQMCIPPHPVCSEGGGKLKLSGWHVEGAGGERKW